MRLRLRFFALGAAISVISALLFTSCFGSKETDEYSGNIHEITTDQPGDIYAVFKFLDYENEVTFKLFPELAPEAVERFIELAERGYYDRRNIHRVVHDLLMQGGSVNFDGSDGTVEQKEFFQIETSEYAYNFYGALGMAPDTRGRNYCQFYIVTNNQPADVNADIATIREHLTEGDKPLNNEAKARLETNLAKLSEIPQNIRELYLTRGGAPQLDGDATVFGQLVGGSEVVDELAKAAVVAGNHIDDELGIPSRPLDEMIIESVTIVRIPTEQEEPEETGRGNNRNRGRTSSSDDTDAENAE